MDHPVAARGLKRLLIGSLTGLLAVTAGTVVTACQQNPPTRPRTPTAVFNSVLPEPTWAPSEPAVADDTHITWAYLDSTEGSMLRGGDTDMHPLDQLVVPGLAAVYLDRVEQRGQHLSPRETSVLFSALAQNEAGAAELTEMVGGVDTVFPNVVESCQLTETGTGPPRATVLDVARYGACLREGTITDPGTAGWVLTQMRHTAGGIGDVRGNDGGRRLAQFNSTVPAGDGRHRTACLGVGAYWSAAVFVDWPADRGDLYGTSVCAEVARTSFPPDTQKAPDLNPAPSATT